MRDWDRSAAESGPGWLTGLGAEAMAQVELHMYESDQEFAYLHDGSRWLVFVYGLWHDDEYSPYSPELKATHGGWRDLESAVAADQLMETHRDVANNSFVLQVGPLTLSIGQQVGADQEEREVQVTFAPSGDSYTAGSADEGDALHAALQRLPQAWLPGAVTPFDIGVRLGSGCAFRDLEPPLEDAGEPDTDTTAAAYRGGGF